MEDIDPQLHQSAVSELFKISSEVGNANPAYHAEEQPFEFLLRADALGIIVTQQMLEETYETANAYHEQYLTAVQYRRVEAMTYVLFSECARLLQLPFNPQDPALDS